MAIIICGGFFLLHIISNEIYAWHMKLTLYSLFYF